MLKLDEPLVSAISKISETISEDRLSEMVSIEGVFSTGHFIYPANEADKKGNHLDSLFLIEPIAKNDDFVELIVEDILLWIYQKHIIFETIFAPAQPSVMRITDELAKRLKARTAYWEYLPSGWFGNKLVSGSINKDSRVLVFNAVSQQGHCVSEHLPQYVQSLGGQVVAAAVFAKGNAPGIAQVEQKYNEKFYSTIQVKIDVQSPADCPLCKNNQTSAVSWTNLRDTYK